MFESFIQMHLKPEGRSTSKTSALLAGRREFTLKSIQSLLKIWPMLALKFLAKLEFQLSTVTTAWPDSLLSCLLNNRMAVNLQKTIRTPSIRYQWCSSIKVLSILKVLIINKIQGKAFRGKVYLGCKASVIPCITALLGTPLPSICRWHISQSVVLWVLLQNHHQHRLKMQW